MHLSDSIARRRQTAKQRDFLSHFASSGSVLASAKLAGVSRQLVYYWREHSPAFAEMLSTAAGNAFRETPPASPQGGQEAATRGKSIQRARLTP